MARDQAGVIFGWIFIGVVLIIAIPGLLYFGALILKPYFISFAILFAVLTILSVIALIFLRDEDFAPYLLIPLGIFGLLTLFSIGGIAVTTNIIQTVPNSTDGKASIDMVNDTIKVANVGNEISDTLQNVLNQQLEETCKQYDPEACEQSKRIVEIYKNTQELQDWIEKGNKLIDFVENHKAKV